MKKFSLKDYEKLLPELRKEGLTVKEIAERLGKSEGTVSNYLAKLGLTRSADTGITVEEVTLLYKNGMTANEIAKKLNVSHSTVKKRLLKAGIEINRAENIHKHFFNKYMKIWDDIRKDMDNGLTKKDITLKYHMRMSTLDNLIDKNNYVRLKNTGIKNLPALKELFKNGTRAESIAENFDYLILYIEENKKNPTLSDLAVYSGKALSTISQFINKYNLREYIDFNGVSHIVSSFLDFVNTLNITYELNNRKILDGAEIDVWCPEHNIGFEINPTLTHSPDRNLYGNRNMYYHQKKTVKAFSNDIILIHIYDYDWCDEQRREILKDKIRSYFHKPLVIGARKCNIKQVNRKESSEFLNKYHLQGDEKSSFIRYGLYFNNDLLSILTVGRSRYADADYELIRYCTRPDIGVTGGFARLFGKAVSLFKKDDSIITYLDFDKKFNIKSVYEKAGFKYMGLTKPSYVWIHKNSSVVRSRYSAMKKILIKKSTEYESMTEREIMKSEGYLRIFDSGNEKYLFIV